MEREKKLKYLGIVLALVIAATSFFGVSKWASDPETYDGTMKTLGELQDKALGLTASATALATGAAAIPGDATTPIANKLADVAGYMVIVYVAIILEKYLLTLMGMVAFKFLIPIGMIALVISALFLSDRWKQIVNRMAIKFMAMGILLWLLVPVSAKTTNIINNTYESTRLSDPLSEEEESEEEKEEVQTEEESSEASGFWNQFLGKFADLADSAKDKVDSKLQEFQDALNRMIEGVAVMIVTTCAIPIGVLLLFLWIIRTVTGIQISTDGVKNRLLTKKKETNE